MLHKCILFYADCVQYYRMKVLRKNILAFYEYYNDSKCQNFPTIKNNNNMPKCSHFFIRAVFENNARKLKKKNEFINISVYIVVRK